jgi:hypothetical protein
MRADAFRSTGPAHRGPAPFISTYPLKRESRNGQSNRRTGTERQRHAPAGHPGQGPEKTREQTPAEGAEGTTARNRTARGAGVGAVRSGVHVGAVGGPNGYANAQHSPVAWPGWLMGLAVPVIVLTLARVAGEKCGAGKGAWAGGPAGRVLRSCS